MSDPLSALESLESCWCHACFAALDREQKFYILCPSCGNKRCPRSTNHLHACTGLNDSGQIGSVYGEDCPEECCQTLRAIQDVRRREFEAFFGEELAAIRAERKNAHPQDTSGQGESE